MLGCGAWSLVAPDGVATSKYIGKLAARRGSLVVRGVGGGGGGSPLLDETICIIASVLFLPNI